MDGRRLCRIGAVLIVLAAAWFGRGVLAYVLSILLGGALLALLVNPACRRLEGRMPRVVALACVWLGIVLLAVGLMAALIPAILRQVNAVRSLWPQWMVWLRRGMPQLGAAQWTATELGGVMQQFFGAFQQVRCGVARLVDICSRVGMMWIVSIFLILDRERYALKAELLVPFRWRRQVVAVTSRIGRELSLFLRGQMLVGLCVGALSALGLFCIGLDNALLMGILVGAFNLIPYFGPVFGAVPVLLSAAGGGWQLMLMSIVVLVVVQQLDGMWISPGIMSSVTGLSPLMVLLAMATGGAAMGIFGMLVAIPAAIALRIVIRELLQHSRCYRN